MVSIVLDYLKAGESIEGILSQYPTLHEEDIRAAIGYAARLAHEEDEQPLHTTVTAFDCVETKRRIQEKIYEETQGMGPEELAAYFRRRVREGPFADLWHPGARKPVDATSK